MTQHGDDKAYRDACNGFWRGQQLGREIADLNETGPDYINHPPHYTQGDIECIDAMKACSTDEEFRGYLKLSAFKYLWRLGRKGEDDAQKARWYINRLAEEMGVADE